MRDDDDSEACAMSDRVGVFSVMGRDRHSSSHRHHHSRSPRRPSKALTADEKEFLRAQNKREDRGRREGSILEYSWVHLALISII